MQRLEPVARGASLAAPILALLLLLPTHPAVAQDSDGFLFGRPTMTLGLYGGYAVPGAGSEIFEFVRDRLTVDRGDFRSAAFGGWLGVRVSERLDVTLDVARSGAETASEFRDWVDLDDNPIRQTTSLSRTSATLNVKAYARERGRSIGRYVWIPRGVSPYLGAGGGLLWYGFEQEGDFVDFQTLDIFRDEFRSDGQTAVWQLLGGVDVSVSPRLLLTAELRHAWASAEMGEDFVGFDPIDLSGFQGTVGMALRM